MKKRRADVKTCIVGFELKKRSTHLRRLQERNSPRRSPSFFLRSTGTSRGDMIKIKRDVVRSSAPPVPRAARAS